MRLLPPTRFLSLLLGSDLPLLLGESEAVGIRLQTDPLHPPRHELVHDLPVRLNLLRRKVLVDGLFLSTYPNFDFRYLEVGRVLLRIAATKIKVVLGGSADAGGALALSGGGWLGGPALVLAWRLGHLGLELKKVLASLGWVWGLVSGLREGSLGGRLGLLQPIRVVCSSL